MKRISSLLLSGVLLAGTPFVSGCAVDSASEVESFGQVRMALTGTSVEGNLYRLRAATFTIEGPASAVLATEENPDITVLSADLPPGAYTSTLGGNWYLEREDGVGFVPVEAMLISANPADFQVNAQVASELVYQFSTDGTIVTIGDGSVDISIEVIEVGATDECVMFEAGTCPSGEMCTVGSLETLGGVCVPAGTGLFGDPCAAASDCAPKHVCAMTSDDSQICVELCDMVAPTCVSGTCNDIGSPVFGACL